MYLKDSCNWSLLYGVILITGVSTLRQDKANQYRSYSSQQDKLSILTVVFTKHYQAVTHRSGPWQSRSCCLLQIFQIRRRMFFFGMKINSFCCSVKNRFRKCSFTFPIMTLVESWASAALSRNRLVRDFFGRNRRRPVFGFVRRRRRFHRRRLFRFSKATTALSTSF